jgi:hypothetical protein
MAIILDVFLLTLVKLSIRYLLPPITIGKLVSYNCPQILINWIANYLTDRTQSVTCSSGCSLPLRNTRSIIQGSGFGPAGFIAYNAVH